MAQVSVSDAWRSPNLIYRAVEAEDAAFVLRMYSDSASLLNYYAGPAAPRGMDAAKRLHEVAQTQLLSVLICLPALDSNTAGAPIPIGEMRLRAHEMRHAHHRNATLGIFVMKQHQGKGYGSEAIKWCLRWAFRMANLHRVQLGSFGWNPRAIALYERLGFVHEGRKREHFWFDGEYHDYVQMAILDREWKEKYGSDTKSSADQFITVD